MAQTLEQLEEQLASLREAKASGALIVRHGDTQVTYRSMAELKEAIADLVTEVNKLNGVSRGPRYVRQSKRGY